MRMPRPIREWWFPRPDLDRELFEELCERYGEEGDPVWQEFVCRLSALVFQAAVDCATRRDIDIAESVVRVFEEFKPTFASGSAESLLRRLAGVIRRRLDATAFESIAFRYYVLGPIYHLKDDEQRRLLAVAYQMRLGPGVERQLAERFGMHAVRVADVLKRANLALRRAIRDDFSDLRESTEGYLFPEQFED
jgi:hypothetical protein